MVRQSPFPFEAILKYLSEGVYVTNQEGIVLYVNEAFTHLTGILKEDITGNAIQPYIEGLYKKGIYDRIAIETNTNGETFQHQTVEKPDSLYRMVINKKAPVTYSGFLTFKEHTRHILFNGYPLYDEGHRIKYVVVTLQDLTYHNQLKEKINHVEQDNLRKKSEIDYFKAHAQKNNLIGESEQMINLKIYISKIASTDATVMITGETGVGKEVIAKEIHNESNRRHHPYIKINCAAIPEHLMESELFGYEKGAFTGAANKAKLGLFELANGGTLLLDEIGEMPMALQKKLLRVLQEKEMMRVGGVKPISLDVRIIASTNVNLLERIEAHHFREDLYYRLNVLPITVPPLRERPTDIVLITEFFLNQFGKKYNKDIVMTDRCRQLFKDYAWPGNVRELKNIVERLCIVQPSGVLEARHIKPLLTTQTKEAAVADEGTGEDLKSRLDAYEKEILKEALQYYGNTYKAAEALGVTQSTISRKAKKLGIKYW